MATRTHKENHTLKTCKSCAEEKDASFFYVDRASKDGLQRSCKDCKSAYQKKWFQENKDKVNAYNMKRYYSESPEQRAKRKADALKWNHNNLDKRRKIVAESAARNPETRRQKEHLRRARLRGNGVFHVSKKEIKTILSKPCFLCESKNNIVIDHIIPIAKGGTHSIGNLQPLCDKCNSRKNSKLMAEFRYKNTARKAA